MTNIEILEARHEKMRQRQRINERAYRIRCGPKQRPFVGCDGEGGDINGRHVYTCLRAGDQELFTGKPLSSRECLGFIADLPSGPIYVGYYFGYDITMILKDLPTGYLRDLKDSDKRKIISNGHTWTPPIVWNGFDIQLIGHREFKVRRRHSEKPYTTIHDVSGCFQSTFLKAIRRWEIGTLKEQAQIEAGKEGRGSWGMATESIREYNKLECTLLVQMMDSVRVACTQVGIHPRTWQGAGQLAESMLESHYIGDYLAPIPAIMSVPTATAYFGGRFEITKQGLLDKVYEYDLNSAYPSAMRSLPCLRHGQWRKGRVSPGSCGLSHVSWRRRNTSRAIPQPFPFRSHSGRISYPSSGRGWYWSPELEAALDIGLWDIEIDEGYVWHQTCDHKPFDWIEDIYNYRKTLTDGRGIVLKLAMNSLYGKMAQSVGKPRFHSNVWAGLITSHVRAQLLKDSHANGNAIMFATDAIYFEREAKTLQIGDNLGQYGRRMFPKYFIVLPGFHFPRGGSIDKTKTRGISG
ncbi:MAG: DNA polymerase, partial [Rhabdochlamydiaceae bacterium]